MSQTPSLFVSHGSPMFALTPGKAGPLLARIGRALSGVRAVLVVSPHWQTRGVRVMATAAPPTMHDFGGFPEPLYALHYPAPGAPALAQRAAAALRAAGFDIALDEHRGFDHGAWVPMRYLYPDASTPTLQVSMPIDLDAAGALRLGTALAPLRDEGVLVVGSGSLTHNLGEFRRPLDDIAYIDEFADWVRAAVERGDIEALVDYRRRAPHAQRAHPSEEHFLPLLIALGAAGETSATWIDGGTTDRILRMDGAAWGLDALTHSALQAA